MLAFQLFFSFFKKKRNFWEPGGFNLAKENSMIAAAKCENMDTERIETAAPPPDGDAILMSEVAGGSEHALRMLIEKWKNPLANYFYRSVRDAHAAEDMAQQTFVNLYGARESYVPSAKFSTYLFRIARHVLINEFRKSARRPCDPTDPADMTAVSSGRGELEAAELEEIFYSALETMPENQRTAILLYKQQELTYEEIAAAMDASVAAVKTWIFRARTVLREALKNAR